MSNASDILSEPVNIVSNLPSNRTKKNLVELCNPKQWKTISQREMSKTGYPVFGANGFIGYYPKYNHVNETIAITCRGATCGTVNLVPKKSYITGNSMCLDNVSPDTDVKYLYYASSYRTLSDVISGSAQPQITFESLKSVILPIPSLPEQKKIASIITSVDEVIENTQKQIDKLQDLKKATMNELLTKGIGHTEFKDSELGQIPKSWKCIKTKQLLDFKNGLNKEKEAFGSGQKIVNYMDVFSNTEINAEKIKGRVELNNSEINRFEVRDGDIFFTRTSETPDEVGLSSVILNLDETCCFSGFILRGRQLENILYPPLSGIFFRTDYIRKQIIKTCTYTTRALTNGNSLGRINIAVPSIKEQILIYKHIGSISNKIIKTKKIIKKYKLLKKSLMQQLLTGKVRVSVN